MDEHAHHLQRSKIIEVAEYFLEAVASFRQVYESFREDRLRFEEMVNLVDDRGESILFKLKEATHFLFRDGVEQTEISEQEQLFDLTVGALFHLAMKVREDLYQQINYNPKLQALERKTDRTPDETDFLYHLRNLHQSAGIKEEMEEAHRMMDDVIHQFLVLVNACEYKGTLIRFFQENPLLVEKAFGAEGMQQLRENFYAGNREEMHFAAGLSYFKGGYFEKALYNFEESLPSTAHPERNFFIPFTKGLIQIQEENYSQALESLRQGLKKVVNKTEFAAEIAIVTDYLQELSALEASRMMGKQKSQEKKVQTLLQQLSEIPA